MHTAICRVSLFVFVALMASSVWAAPKVLTFDPPDRVDFTVNSVSARTQYLGDARLGTDSTFKSATCLLEKSGSGWRLNSTLTQCGMKRDSLFSDAVLRQIMTGLKISMQIDSVGGAVSTDGFQKLQDRIKALPDTAASNQLKEILSPDLMATKEVDEWNIWMARLVGRPFVVGSVTHATEDLKLPDDAELLSFEFSFLLDTLRFQERLYGRLMTYIDTDPLRLAKATNRSPKRMAEIFQMPDSAVTILSEPMSDYRMTSEVIFDVETLLITSEKTEREIILRQYDEPGRTVFSRLVETSEKQFTYTKR